MGRRSLLATVAGSMITVAGVTFSLTILAVSYATAHFGPRLLDNFMHNRGNQFTLGTFVATFLYCLLVLRTVLSGTGPGGPEEYSDHFVPHLSILIAMVLTLLSVGVLIFFIHHVPESIHIYNVLERISKQMRAKIDDLYPEAVGEPIEDNSSPFDFDSLTSSVTCSRSGYLQGVDDESLMETARHCDAVIELRVRPGDYLLLGQEIAGVSLTCDDDQTANIRSAFAIGISRTPTQDLFFILNQFTEIAIRTFRQE